MGNICKSMGLCSCLFPTDFLDDDVDFDYYSAIEAKRTKQQSIKLDTKSLDVFTIFNSNLINSPSRSLTYSPSSSLLNKTGVLIGSFMSASLQKSCSIRSLNEHKLYADFADSHLFKMSNEFNSTHSSELLMRAESFDSGMESLSAKSASGSNELVKSYESLFDFDSTLFTASSSVSTNSLFASSPFSLIKNSSFYAWSKNSIKRVKHGMLKLAFITNIKANIRYASQQCLTSSTVSKKLEFTSNKNKKNVDSKQQQQNNDSSLNSMFIYGVVPLRQFLLRIYDVNYF